MWVSNIPVFPFRVIWNRLNLPRGSNVGGLWIRAPTIMIVFIGYLAFTSLTSVVISTELICDDYLKSICKHFSEISVPLNIVHVNFQRYHIFVLTGWLIHWHPLLLISCPWILTMASTKVVLSDEFMFYLHGHFVQWKRPNEERGL